MTEIEYHGGNAVTIITKERKLHVDPRVDFLKLKQQSIKNDVQIATEDRFLVEESQLSLEGPGEYEVAPFSIRGVAAQRHIDENGVKKSTIYRVEVNGLAVAVLGNISPTLTEAQLEAIGVVDVLIVPVGGGGYTLDATSATAIVRKIAPKVVVPVHYADSDVAYEVPQEDVAVFAKELGASVEQVEKIKIKTTGDIPEVMTVLQLARKP